MSEVADYKIADHEITDYKITGGIATITLDNGKANAISHQLIDELNLALDRAEQDKAVVIITGTPGMLSAGYDLKIMQESMEAAMALVKRGSTLSKRLMSFPAPVIIACNGHAVAKGAFLLLSADLRIGVTGIYKIGLNEVAIGMTMHHAGLEIAQYRLPATYFQRAVICAEMFTPDEAVKAGFLDMVVPEEQLMVTANNLARGLTKLNKRAHKGTKLKARAGFLARLETAIEKDTTSSL